MGGMQPSKDCRGRKTAFSWSRIILKPFKMQFGRWWRILENALNWAGKDAIVCWNITVKRPWPPGWRIITGNCWTSELDRIGSCCYFLIGTIWKMPVVRENNFG